MTETSRAVVAGVTRTHPETTEQVVRWAADEASHEGFRCISCTHRNGRRVHRRPLGPAIRPTPGRRTSVRAGRHSWPTRVTPRSPSTPRFP